MDRPIRRQRRDLVRARRIKVAAGVVLAAASVAVLAATAFGQAQGPSDKPTPRVDKVDLTPAPVPVGAGWEGQVGTDANLVAVQWNGDPSAAYTFEVRDHAGTWRNAAGSGTFDTGPDPGTADANAGGATPQTKNVTDPVWVGKDVTGVRVRLDSGSAQDVTLHVIDSTTGKQPGTSVESTSATPTTPPAPSPAPASTSTTTEPVQQGVGIGSGLAAAALATLAVAFIVRRRRLLAIVVVAAVLLFAACAPTKSGPPSSGAPIPGGIVPRSSWGGDLHWACPGGPEYAYVANAIVHHTVNSNNYGPGDSVGMIRGIWAYHVQSLGYCDIAYNFLIDNYGTAFEGRMGGIDQPVVGAHALNWNVGTTGIAVLGTFTSVSPSGAVEATLTDLIRWKFKVHGVNPFDEPGAHILGHRDTFATECPGQALYNDLNAIGLKVIAGW
jgi:N-acetylmuramoyl-L-alanine amidase